MSKIDKITNLPINDEINEYFDQIKSLITIKAKLDNFSIIDHQIRVTMRITIDDFCNWMSHNHLDNFKQYTRLLWYNFITYAKRIIDYGYHFNNIEQINRFVDIPDTVIQQIADDNNYNVTCSAEVCQFEEESDKNSFTFLLIAEAFLSDENPDEDIKSRPYPKEDSNDVTNTADNSDNELDKLIDELAVSESDKLAKALEQYKKDGIKHAEIADVLYRQSRDAQTNIELCRNLIFNAKPTQHIINGNHLTIKFALTKKIFAETFSSMRDASMEKAWSEYTQDMINNPHEYSHWDKISSALSIYMIKHNFKSLNQSINIHDAYVDNNGLVLRYFADIILEL